MQPSGIIVFCAATVFGLVAASAPRSLFRAARNTRVFVKTADPNPSAAKVRLVRVLGFFIAVASPVFAALSVWR